jgi:hypothetical protein
MTTISQMSKGTAGITMTVPSTALTYPAGGTEINNNLILSAWICQLVVEEEEDEYYFDTMIHSVMSTQRLRQHHQHKEGSQRRQQNHTTRKPSKHRRSKKRAQVMTVLVDHCDVKMHAKEFRLVAQLVCFQSSAG